MRQPAAPLALLLAAFARLSLAEPLNEIASEPFSAWQPEREAPARGDDLAEGALFDASAEDATASTSRLRAKAPPAIGDRAFPATIGNLSFVAGAHRLAKLFGMQVQLFDVALYLDRSSDLWFRDVNADMLSAHAPGAAQLRLKVTSGLINSRRLIAALQKTATGSSAGKSSARGVATAMDNLERTATDAGGVSVGSLLDLHLTAEGVHFVLDGKDLVQKAKERMHTTSVLARFVGASPDMEGFKADIFRNLRQGWDATESERHAKVAERFFPIKGHKVWTRMKSYILIFSIVGFLAMLSLGICVWGRAMHNKDKAKAEALH